MLDFTVFFIQCDWDEIIRKPQGTVWVSLKKKDEPHQIHGKIKNVSESGSNITKLTATNEFTAKLLMNDIIKVEHKDSSSAAIFVAPTKIYCDIHKTSIPCLDVTTTGLSVSYGMDNDLVVWDFNKGDLKVKLIGHVGEVYQCKFFPSEKVVLTGGSDMQLKIWCAETGQCPVTLKGHKRAVTDFAIIDKGRNVISVSKDGSAKLWDCGESSCLDTLIHVSSDINSCSVTCAPSGFQIGHPDDSDISTEREIGTENKLLLFGCEDGTVHCIAVYSRRKIFTIVLKSAVNSVEFLSLTGETDLDNKFIVGCQNGEVLLYSVNNIDRPIKSFQYLNSAVLQILSFKDLGFFVSHADGSVYFIRNNLDGILFSLSGPDCDPVYDMTTDGQFLYTSCRDGVIRRYSIDKTLTYLT